MNSHGHGQQNALLPSGHLMLEQRWNVVEITSWRCSKLDFNVDPTYSACRVMSYRNVMSFTHGWGYTEMAKVKWRWLNFMIIKEPVLQIDVEIWTKHWCGVWELLVSAGFSDMIDVVMVTLSVLGLLAVYRADKLTTWWPRDWPIRTPGCQMATVMWPWCICHVTNKSQHLFQRKQARFGVDILMNNKLER